MKKKLYFLLTTLFLMNCILKKDKGPECLAGVPCETTGVSDTIFQAIEKTMKIDAKSNIFGSGHKISPNPGGKGRGILPPFIEFPENPKRKITIIEVTGEISCEGKSKYNAPDGGNYYAPTDISSYNGISGIIHRSKTMFLIGVFSDVSEPVNPAPRRLDFSSTDDFLVISPELNQIFFIGDGKTGTNSGDMQQFIPPSGSTRLFFGFADGEVFTGLPGAYEDNLGELIVKVRIE